MDNLRRAPLDGLEHPPDRPALGWGERKPRLVLESAGVSHPGRRRSNEDQYLIADLAAARRRAGRQPSEAAAEEALLVVADGMGGHPSGEVASLLAVRVLLKELVDAPSSSECDPLGWLELAVRSSDEAIHRTSARRRDLAAMGTTLTAAWWIPPMLFYGHVGDSRLYLLRDGRLTRLTRDHTVSADLGHVLTQAIGGSHRGADPDLGVRRLEPGDWLLLCTDGVVGGVTEEEIARVLTLADSARTAAMALLEGALATGDGDNITALAVRVWPAARRGHLRPRGAESTEAP
ncbi:MAG TPA: protein phosphatase 2C domain-containing protein [Thermoanaerobaculia bacterium]|nr:protein phosphatase 2C domain-containing protein [Thermoanaerobaculia bacterium]